VSAKSLLPRDAWHAPHCLKGVGGAPTRRTGHRPKYIQYEGLRPARREHAPPTLGCARAGGPP